MRLVLVAGLALGLTLTAGSQAWAQRKVTATFNQTPSEYKNLFNKADSDTPETVDGYIRVLTFGRCMTNISGKLATEMLATAPNTPSELRKFMISNDRFSSCKDGDIVTAQSLRRGSVAEALVKKTAKGWAFVPLAADGSDYAAYMTSEKTFDAGREANDRDMIAATNCMVAQQPGLAWQILQSTHGSPEETTQMDAMFAKAPGCAGAQRPNSLSRSFLRAFLAQSVYRLWLHDSSRSSAKAGG